MFFLRSIAVFLFLSMASTAIGQETGDYASTPSADSADPAWLAIPAGPVERLPPVISDEETSPPPADAAKGRFMPPGMNGQGKSPFSYRATWFPTVPVSGQNTNFTMLDQNLSVMVPLGKMPSPEDSTSDATAGIWLLSAGVKNKMIETGALLPDTGQTYPDQLWNVNMGLMYFRKLANDWSWGGGVNFGSASDRPFASIDEMFVGMNAFLRIPSGEHNAWMLAVAYAPMGELRFPIPLVSYYYAPSDNFHLNIGLPFSLMYRPFDRFTLEASYMPIHTIRAKGKYEITDWLSVFAAYDWANDSYQLAGRLDVNQRFFMYDQRLAAGLESKIGEHWTAELAAGLIFDRYSFEGKQWDTTQFNRVSFGSGPFVTLQAGLRF